MACIAYSKQGNGQLLTRSEGKTSVVAAEPLPTAASGPGYAIDARGLKKSYKLYPSVSYQVMDLLGFYRLMPWRRQEVPLFPALDSVDLKIARGERVGIIGRNGSGKTTLLKLITGATEPSAGSVQIDGNVQALMQIGVGFHPEFTGFENIRASLLFSGLTETQRKDAEAEIIEFCELGDFLGQPLKTYSLGMQSRLQFACATAIKPEILIVDEILGAGDAYFTAKSSMRMEQLTKSGCTLLLVSHSMAQILQFCEHVLWIDNGRIRLSGSARDVVGAYEVFMENMSANELGTGAGASKGLASQKLLRVEASDLKADEGPGRLVDEPDAIGKDVSTDEGSAEELSSSTTVSHTDINQFLPTSGGETCSTPVASDEAADNCFLARLDDGQEVYRWPSSDGPKLIKIGLFHDGRAVSKFKESESVEFRFTVRNESEKPIACCYQITIFTLDSKRITRLFGPVDTFSSGKGKCKSGVVSLDPCLLGVGEYYINFAILPDNAMKAGTPMSRFDLVARFCDFEVTRILDYRDPTIFKHPAIWSIG